MASVLDQLAQVGKEATYGTAITPTRAYEITEDTWQRDVEQLTSTGLRAGKHAQVANRRRPIDLGATGTLIGPCTTTSMGLLLSGLLGGSTAPAQQASTSAYQQTFTTNTDGPTESYTIRIGRTASDGTLHRFNYTGCSATGFNFACEQGAEMTYRIDYSAQGEDITSDTTAAVYPASEMYIYSDITLTIAGATTNAVRSFSLDGDLAMDTDRRFLRGSARRVQPRRNGEPTFTGTLSAEFADRTIYDAFVSGDDIALTIRAQTTDAIDATTGPSPTTYYPTLEFSMPAVRFDGATPNASTSELTSIEAPFSVVWNGSDAALSITYISSDTAA